MRNNNSIAVVIPCYKVENQIESVVSEIPHFVDKIILVNDCSPDNTQQVIVGISQKDSRVVILQHERNLGVGGAMLTGFKETICQNIDIVVKIDGDGQMDVTYIASLVDAVTLSGYNYAKGNRFFNRKQLQHMPIIRRIGNLGIGFLVKMASGYYNVSDPSNGFFCMRTDLLKNMELNRISNRFFFESSLIIELYYAGARIKEIFMPAIYADEKSNLSEWNIFFTFPPKLFKAYFRRIWLRYFIYDFNIASIYNMFGIPMFLFGLIFGIIKWIHYGSLNIPAPTGTIMISVIALVLGFQMMLAAVQYDIQAHNPFDIDK